MNFFNDNTIKDPCEDREEFSRRIDSILDINCEHFLKNAVHAFLSDDIDKISDCKIKHSQSMAKKQEYLSRWDKAKDKNEKQIVVSSVRK